MTESELAAPDMRSEHLGALCLAQGHLRSALKVSWPCIRDER